MATSTIHKIQATEIASSAITDCATVETALTSLNSDMTTLSGKFVTNTKNVSLNSNGNASLSLNCTQYILLGVMCTDKTDCVCIPYRYGSTTIGIHCIKDASLAAYGEATIAVRYVAYKFV